MLIGALALGASARAEDRDFLEQGWTEYRFQSFDAARDLFERAEIESADDGDRREAMLGQAMVDQFRESGDRLGSAVDTYRRLREESKEDRVGVLASAMLAEGLFAQGSLEEANLLWDEVIGEHPGSLAAQDALIRRTTVNLGPMLSDQTLDAVRYAEEKRKGFPVATRENPGLSPALDLLLGDIYFWRENYAAARDAFMRYLEIASVQTVSYATLASVFMRVARLSELRLDDPETAGRVYKQMVLETPNDVRAYFAMQKAIELGNFTREEVVALGIEGLSEREIDELFVEFSDR